MKIIKPGTEVKIKINGKIGIIIRITLSMNGSVTYEVSYSIESVVYNAWFYAEELEPITQKYIDVIDGEVWE